MLFHSGKNWGADFFLHRGWPVRQRLERRRRRGAGHPLSTLPPECLEERTLLSTITVTTLTDETTTDGQVSLREAIEAANTDTSVDGSVAGDVGVTNTIVFTPGLTGTISLALGEMTISSSMIIQGLGATNTLIDAQQNSRIFDITSAAGNVTFGGMTLENGKTTAAGRSSTGGAGGAIFSASAGTLSLSGDVLSGNSTTGNQASGGAIFANGPVTIVNSTLSGNLTSGPNAAYGGAIYSAGAVTVLASTLSGNSTSGIHSYGGALFTFGDIQLTNSTVTGNRATGSGSNAGALWTGAALTATNSTIAQNSASNGQGGGVYQWIFDPNPVVTLKNTIVAENTDDGTAPDLSIIGSAAVTVTHSLIGDNTGTTLTAAPVGSPDTNGNLIGKAGATIDPLLGALASNGGPTLTMALLVGSPAINAGSDSLAVDPSTNAPLVHDQRGTPFSRINGSAVDMGAYEKALSLVVNSTDDVLDPTFNPAHVTLRDALALTNANPGFDSITFDPSINGTPIVLTGGEMSILDTVNITGNGTANTILDAQQNSRIFNITSGAGDVTLEGLTLKNGKTSGSGGAILSASAGTLTISDSAVTNSTITGNHASGGAIADSGGSVTITNSTLTGNSTTGQFAQGGAVYTSAGDVSISGSTLSGNSTGNDFSPGGAVSTQHGQVTVTNSTLSGNSTVGSYAPGGAVYARFGAVTITGCTLSGNSTTRNIGRGGAVSSGNVVTVLNSTLSGNSTAGTNAVGGAINAFIGVSVTNSTITGNSTSGTGANGGAIFAFQGNVTAVNSTIVKNHATNANGGGVYASYFSGTVTLANTILAQNTAGGTAPDLRATGALSVSHSLIGDNTGTTLTAAPVGSPDANGNLIGTAGAPINPMLGALASNGGPTLTMAPLAGSPAIDAGSNLLAVDPATNAPLMYDQRGAPFLRISINAVDMGAYESPAMADLVVTKTGPATAVAGTNVTYTVTITNNGPSDAQNVALADTLPAGETFVSQSQPAAGPQFSLSHTGNAISDTIATLAAGASQTFTIVALVNANTLPGTLSNTATGSSTTTDASPGNESSTANTTVSTQADLVVTKSDSPDPVSAGNQITYTVTVTDNGPSDAQAVSLSDAVPANTTLVSVSVPAGWTETDSVPVGGTRTLTFTKPTLASGAVATFTILVQVNPNTANNTIISNTATATTTTNDPNIATNGTATTTTTVNTQADIAVTKTGPATVFAGNQITYTVTITNNGPSDAQNVALADTLPARTSFVSQSQPGSGPQFSLNHTGNAINDTIATLAAGASQTFTIIASVPASTTNGTVIGNTATGSTTTTDPTPGNDSSTANTTVNTQADLAVTSTGPLSATAGTDLTYSITVTNNGPSDAQNTALVDTIPNHTTRVSFVQNTGPALGGTLPAGQTQTFTLIVHSAADTPNGTVVTNTADVGSSTTDNDPTNNSSPFQTIINTSADLVVTKTGPASAFAGNQITYTVTVTNNGPSDAQDVALADTFLSGLSFASQSQPGSGPQFSLSHTGNSINDTIATLAAGASQTFTVIALIGASASAGTYSNTATVSTSTNDPDPANSSTASTTVTTQADLAVVKTGPATAIAGTDITYSITVTNNGPSDAQAATVNDVLPTGTTFVSFVQDTGSSDGTTLAAGGTRTFTLIAHVKPDVADGTVITNTASVSSTTTDPNPSNDSSDFATTVGTHADLAVVKTGPVTGIAGTDITYSITVTNNGPSDAQAAAVDDVLPAGTTFVSFVQDTGSPDGSTLVTGGTRTFTLIAHLNANVPDGTIITNTASVSSTRPDPNPSNNSSPFNTTVIAQADLSITKSGPAQVNAGDPAGFDYTLTVTNNGPSDNAGGFTVSDVLPTGFSFQSGGSTAGGSVVAQTVSYTNATGLAAGASQTFVLHVTVATSVPDMTTVHNTGSVATNGTTDPNSSNNVSNTVDTLVRAGADLSISKAGPGTAVAGDPNGFNYTVVVTNNGFLNNVGGFTVTDVLPAGLAFQAAGSTAGALVVGQTVSFTNTTGLAFGASQTFTIHVRLSPSAPDGAVLSNSASVVSNGTVDPFPNNNTSNTIATTVLTRADLALSSALLTMKPTGQMQTFTLTLTNNGPSDAQNVLLTDALPADTMLVAESQDSGPVFLVTPANGGASLLFSRSTLAAGASATFTLITRVTSPQPDGTGLSNIANVSSSTTDPNLLNNQTVAKAVLSNRTDLVLSVTPSLDTVNPGGKEVFTLTVTNNGPNEAQNVVLSDTLPTTGTLKFLSQTAGPPASVVASPIGSVGGSIQWSFPTLALGQSATFLILVTPNGGARFLTNTATVTTGTVDVNPTNNSVKTIVTVGAGQTASVVKGVATPAAMTKGSVQAFDAVLHRSTNLVHHTLRGRGYHRRHRHG